MNKKTLILVCLLVFNFALSAKSQDRPLRGALLKLMQNRNKTHKKLSDEDLGTKKVTIESGGTSRVFHVHIPANYNKDNSTPIVFVFHGGGGTALGAVRISGMNSKSEKEGFIAVYPNAVEKHWNDGRTDLKKQTHEDDVGFVKDIIAKLEQELNIDKSRIYTCGISNGGLFSQRLACELPQTFAAAASVAANLAADHSAVPSRPFSIMYMLGTDDPLMPFNGGYITIPLAGTRGKVISGQESVNTWVKYNHCPAKPVISTYGQAGQKLSIESQVYGPGTNNTEVVFCIVQGGGHCWPGGIQYLPGKIIGYTSPLSANDIIWDFFKRHTLAH